MKTFQDYITDEFKKWISTKSLFYKKISENLYVIYNSEYCLKIYDRLGHGYCVSLNLSNLYNETIYEDDTCSIYWVFRYFGLKQKSDFSNRMIDNYEENLPLLIFDIKTIIEAIEKTENKFWESLLVWIDEQAKNNKD